MDILAATDSGNFQPKLAEEPKQGDPRPEEHSQDDTGQQLIGQEPSRQE